MAAWANGSSSGTGQASPNGKLNSAQRKKWNLEDRSSLHNLKTQIAQEGCSDLQFDLAKQLLNETCDPIDGHGPASGDFSSYHQQGIHWLLRAAQQGHEQAIVMLGDCYTSGRGINESNEGEVRLCLAMSPAERAARKAARELFLCLSNGGEFITASQLENKMREIYQMDKGKKKGNQRKSSTQCLQGRANSAEMVTEANLISAAVNYSNGQLPNLNQTVCVTVPYPGCLDHIPLFYRPLVHPILFFTILYYRLVEKLATLPDLLWHYKIPIILLLYLVLSREGGTLLKFVPTALYFATVFVMVIVTFKMLKVKHEFIDFRLWSGLFQYYGRELSLYRETTEHQFLRNNLRPYVYFFGALLMNLLLHPVVKHELLPYSELTIIAFALAGTTSVAFLYTTKSRGQRFIPDVLIGMSLVVNVLAKYPYDMEHMMNNSWEIFDAILPAHSLHGPGQGIEFRLNFRTMFYLFIPMLLIQIASCEKWRGLYKYLIPHCVTLSWLQIGINASHHSTMFGLVRAGVELVGAILFLPLLGLITMLLPILSAVETFLNDQKVKIVTFIVLGLVLIIVYGYLSNSGRLRKFLLPIQISLYALAIFTYVIPLMERNLKLLEDTEGIYDDLPVISVDDQSNFGPTWDVYSKYCHSTAANRIDTQIRCTLLDGERVRWDGTVKSIELAEIRNTRMNLLSYVYPKMVRNFILCLLGEHNHLDCAPAENCDRARSFVEGRWKCNVNKWNVYTHAIRVKMETGFGLSSAPEVILEAGHNFGNFTRRLRASDRVWFVGELNSKPKHQQSMNGHYDVPVINVAAIGCVSCAEKELRYEHSPPNLTMTTIVLSIEKSVKYLLNIIFNPILTFK